MKTLSLIIALLVGILFTNAQEEKTQDITVTIDNVLNNNGKVLIALHSSETFMKAQAIQGTATEIENGTVSYTFKNVTPGVYAILALHDENENNRMDYADSGMPKEAYAMSNNPISYGPPRFEIAKFEVANQNLELKLRF